MDAKQISKLIAADGARVAKIAEQRRYAGGYNVAILGRRAHEEPDNRIPTPICKTGINMVVGYMAVDGKISYSTGDDPYWDEKLKPIFEANDEQLLTKECLKTALRHGRAWVYHYTKDNEARFVQVPIEQCIPIWSDDLPPRLIGMVRHYCHAEEDGKETVEAYYYDDSSITKYTGPKGGDLALAPMGDDGQANPMPQGYLEVPFSERKMSEEGTNLFDSVIHLVDFFDRIISEGFANEEQRSASSYLLLKNRLSAELDESGMSEVDKLKITRTFEDLGDGPVTDSVAFLTKDIPTAFLELITDTFERLIYEQMQVLNPNAMVDTGEISGRAYRFRILMFEYLCADIQTYMSRGIQWGIRLIQNIDKSLSANAQERPQVDIKWERNLPDDMAEAVDQFSKVSPTSLPIRTALGLFPDSFIPDREAVAKEMEEGMGSMSVDDELPGEIGPDGSPRPAGDNVQAQALNGAQVASLVTVAQAVADNQLPLATAVEIVLVAMPTLTREDAMRMLQPADAFTPEKPEVVAPAFGKPAQDANKGE